MMWLVTVCFAGLFGCAPQDRATWRYDTAPPPETDPGGNVEEGDDAEEGEEEIPPGKWLWGELEGSEGVTGYFWLDEQEGERCVVMYAIASFASTDLCTSCEEAWLIERGEESVELSVDGACTSAGWTGLTGTSLGVGVTADEAIVMDWGDGWTTMDVAEVEAEEKWMFFFALLGE